MYGRVDLYTRDSLRWGVSYLVDVDVMNSVEVPLPFHVSHNKRFAPAVYFRVAFVASHTTILSVHDLD